MPDKSSETRNGPSNSEATQNDPPRTNGVSQTSPQNPPISNEEDIPQDIPTMTFDPPVSSPQSNHQATNNGRNN
ncbi:hypothetical protein RBB50_012461 [Rhinocladiella similis]